MLYKQEVAGGAELVQYASVTWASSDEMGGLADMQGSDSNVSKCCIADNAVPYSVEYSDVYYSKSGGVEQSVGVFLRGNDLPMRWSRNAPEPQTAHKSSVPGCAAGSWHGEQNGKKDIFVIGELGFGTGLNFINTCALWERCVACNNPHDAAVTNKELHYITFENRPLTRFDALRIYGQIGRLADAQTAVSSGLFPPSERFSEKYNIFLVLANLAGKHEFFWPEERITLTLFLGDAHRYLPHLERADCSNGVDAWYLDGFSPKLNPSIFCADVYQHMARLSASGATVASYTVSRSVRDGLGEAGFQVRKVAGVGAKREVLSGRYDGD